MKSFQRRRCDILSGGSGNKAPGWVLSIPHAVCLYMFTRQIERGEADERKRGERRGELSGKE